MNINGNTLTVTNTYDFCCGSPMVVSDAGTLTCIFCED